MDETMEKSGDWPNVALVPGTHTHAATGEPVEQPSNTRQSHGEATSDPQTVNLEPEHAAVESYRKDAERKAKKQLRAEAVERLKASEPKGCFSILSDAFGWSRKSSHTDAEWRDALIDLLTDDDCVTAEAETSQVPEHDTREKLVADARRLAFGWSDDTEQEYRLRREVAELLNRQAAITKRECSQDAVVWVGAPFNRGYGWRDIRELLDKIAKLTAERDKLLAEFEAYSDFEKAEFVIPLAEAMKFTTDPPGYVKKHIAELQAERDRLKDVVQKRADSFAKLELELHVAKSGDAGFDLRATEDATIYPDDDGNPWLADEYELENGRIVAVTIGGTRFVRED